MTQVASQNRLFYAGPQHLAGAVGAAYEAGFPAVSTIGLRECQDKRGRRHTVVLVEVPWYRAKDWFLHSRASLLAVLEQHLYRPEYFTLHVKWVMFA